MHPLIGKRAEVLSNRSTELLLPRSRNVTWDLRSRTSSRPKKPYNGRNENEWTDEMKENAIIIHHIQYGGARKERPLVKVHCCTQYHGDVWLCKAVVITQHIHAALYRVATETPVIFINSPGMPGGGSTKATILLHTVGFNANVSHPWHVQRTWQWKWWKSG